MFSPKTIYDEKNKRWHGVDIEDIFHPDVSIGRLIVQFGTLFDDKVIQISDDFGISFTARDVVNLSISAAKKLQEIGLQQEDVVGIVSSNVPYLTPIYVGALIAGMPLNPLDPSFKKNEIQHIFGMTKPKVIFLNADNYELVKSSFEELNIKPLMYTLDRKIKDVGHVDEFLNASANDFVPPKLRKGRDQVAIIMCSSGTTGLPKGICLSHVGLLKQILTSTTINDVLLTFSTVYWYSGFFMLAKSCLSGQLRIITSKPFSPEYFLELIEKYKITTMFVSPAQLSLSLKCPDIERRNLSSLKTVIVGGSLIPEVVIDKWNQYTSPNGHILDVYGMTEMAGGISSQSPEIRIKGSVGQLGPNIELKVIDDDGQSLGVNERGEICVRASHKSFYLNNTTANSQTFDEEGWIHSGDIGYVDKDGNIFLVDRKKDILKYKNFQYSPTEIETLILKIPDILEVCVFGLPDPVCTDLPAVAVVKRKDSNITAKEIFDYVAERLSDHKRLRGGVYFIDSIPRTPSGKAQRNTLKNLIMNKTTLMCK